jgi:prepilin-type N-terminal cleavage/methylation domain-containing protein
MFSDDFIPNHRERGTTLVEVMVTLAILVVLASAFAAEIRDVGPTYRWEQGTQSVVEILRAARQQAIATNRRVDVNLSAGRVAVPTDPTLAAQLPAGVSLSRIPNQDDLGVGIVSFFPRSTCNTVGPIEVSIASHHEDEPPRTRTITLVMATGRVLVR